MNDSQNNDDRPWPPSWPWHKGDQKDQTDDNTAQSETES